MSGQGRVRLLNGAWLLFWPGAWSVALAGGEGAGRGVQGWALVAWLGGEKVLNPWPLIVVYAGLTIVSLYLWRRRLRAYQNKVRGQKVQMGVATAPA